MGTGLTARAAGFVPRLAHFGSVVSVSLAVSLAAPRFRFGLVSGVAAALALLDFLAGDLREGESLDFGVALAALDFGAALAFDFADALAFGFGVALALVCRRAGF